MILRSRSLTSFCEATKLLIIISTLFSTSSLLIETVEGFKLEEEVPVAGQKQFGNVQQTTGRPVEKAVRAIGVQSDHEIEVNAARDSLSANRELFSKAQNSNITLQKSYQVNAKETTTLAAAIAIVVEQTRRKPKNSNLKTTMTDENRSKSNSRHPQQQEKPKGIERKLTQVTTTTLTGTEVVTTLDSTITNLQNQQKKQKHLIPPASSPSRQTRNLSKVIESGHRTKADKDEGRPKILVPYGASTGQRTVGSHWLASPAGAKNNSMLFNASTSDTTKAATNKLEPQRRWPRSAQETTTTSARQAGGASNSPVAPGGAAIHALLGERLTIPCSNLSLLMAEGAKPENQAIVGGSGGLHSSAWQPQRQRNSRRFGNGGGGGGAPPSSLQQQQQQQAHNRPLVANGQGIALIVWHKDDQLDSPIFSADARGVSSLREAKQQTGADGSLGGRAHLEESTRVDSRGKGLTPALVIDEASSSDAGLYTCTVEFHKAPTQTHQVRVLLINPPKNMAITVQDDSGFSQPLLPGIIGPYDEDSQLALSCEVEPGDPAGHLSWWQLKFTSIPTAATTTTIPSNHQAQQRNASPLWQKQPRPQVPIEKADYLTTLDVGDDASEDGARDQFVVFHQSSQEFTTAGNSLASYGDGNHRRRLRHWVRVGAKQESALVGVPGDSSAENRNILKANLQLTLARSTLNNEYLCLARNNELVAPLNSSIKINLNLKPTGIRIANKENLSFKLGQKATIECHVYGSKPEPKLSWLNGTEELESQTTSKANHHQHLSAVANSFYDSHSTRAISADTTIMTTLAEDGDSAAGVAAQNYISEINRDINNNLTKISYLTLVPQLSHNQQQLICSASNPKMPNLPTISDSITMNVQFPAQLSLQFGAGIKPDSIKLGSDVFMDCNIHSNPPIDDLIWLFNDQPLQPQANSSIIMSNQSLVLQRVRIEHRGAYQCLAHNPMGKSQSNKVYLKPKFEPVCDYSLTKTKYEVAVNHAVRVECNVLAEPNEDIHFVWRFNQTSSSFAGDERDSFSHHRLEDIKHYETNFTKSYVMFTPKSRKNYGQLLCSGSNSMGMQERACVIQIVPSELPEPVFGCFFDNKTNNSFSVHCQTPQSSSSRQSYLLELYTNEASGQSTSASNSDSSNNSLDSSSSSHSQRHSTPTTHLRQRQQDNNRDDGDETFNDGASGDALVTNPNNEQSNEQHQLQHQVRSIRSDTPTFHMAELKPNTSYNVIIYVQNSKGRSAPAFYQANTLSDVPNDDDPSIEFSSSSSTAKVQLINNNKRISIWPSGDEQNPFDRFVSFISDSLGFNKNNNANRSDNYKLILRVALLVLMGTISIVTITFFVNRACVGGSAGNRKQQQGQQERRRSRNSVGPSGLRAGGDDSSLARQIRAKEDGAEGDEYSNSSQHQRQPQPQQQPQLAPGTGGLQLTTTSNPMSTLNRIKSLTGNGSDTSRETNTDSTLLSSSRTGGGDGDVSSVGGSGRAGQAPVKVSAANAAFGGAVGTSLLSQTPSPMLRASSIHDEQHSRSILQQKVYSNDLTKRPNLVQSPLEFEQQNSNTPQISIHSGAGGSDCTTSNNGELLQPEGLDAQQFYHHHPYLVKCPDNESPNEPVYVITASESSRRGFVHHEPSSVSDQSAYLAGSQQLRFLNPNNLWPYQLERDGNFIEAPTHGQVSSVGTTTDSCDVSTPTASHSNGFRATPSNYKPASAALVGGQSAGNGLAASQMQFGFLPSSMSIPVSLSDCNQLQNQHLQNQHHRMSQDFLAATRNLCLANTAEVGSYLTLAPEDNPATAVGFSQQHQEHCYGSTNDQQLAEQLALAGIPSGGSHFNCSGNNDECYRTQTLDNSHLRAQARRITQGRITNRTFDPKRGSFDGNFHIGNSILQQQPIQRHHVKFETQPTHQGNIYNKEAGGGLERSNSQMVTTQIKTIDVNQQQKQ